MDSLSPHSGGETTVFNIEWHGLVQPHKTFLSSGGMFIVHAELKGNGGPE